MMHTGLCPICQLRRVLVRVVADDPDEGQVFRVRRHECGARLQPTDIQPLPRSMTKRSTHA